MKNRLADNGKLLARKAAFTQCVLVLIFTVATGLLTTTDIAIAFLVGNLVSILPNQLFTFFAFRYAGASKIEMVAKSFSQGSKIKLALTVILFAIAFGGLKIDPLPVLIGYAVATVSYWLALIRLRQH